VEAAMRLAALAMDLGDLIGAIDLNPVVALPDGVVIVDALIVPVHQEIRDEEIGRLKGTIS
jgi:hypothetical protein